MHAYQVERTSSSSYNDCTKQHVGRKIQNQTGFEPGSPKVRVVNHVLQYNGRHHAKTALPAVTQPLLRDLEYKLISAPSGDL